MDKYDELTDSELIIKIRAGDYAAQDHMLEKYKNIVKMKTRTYYIAGADREDIIQEGMIGLYKALRDFKTERGVLFCTFAELCITRQIITAIKTASRKKHLPLNNSVSLDELAGADKTSDRINPEKIFINKEKNIYLGYFFDHVLSDMEHRVLKSFLTGKSYSEIAGAIERDEKSIDNALQRIRKKLEKALSDWLSDK